MQALRRVQRGNASILIPFCSDTDSFHHCPEPCITYKIYYYDYGLFYQLMDSIVKNFIEEIKKMYAQFNFLAMKD